MFTQIKRKKYVRQRTFLPSIISILLASSLILFSSYSIEISIKEEEPTTWINLNPITNPPSREYPCVAYVGDLDQIFLFGGLSDTYEPLYDFWAYDYNTNNWQNLSSPYFTRYDSSMAYDSESNILLIFGGSDTAGSMPRRDAIWCEPIPAKFYNVTSETGGPSARGAHSMTYDSKADRIIL